MADGFKNRAKRVKKSTGKLPNIQTLRGFAALNVVVFHSIGNAKDYRWGPEYLDFLAGWGMNGVDIFFVISGYIMIYSQWGRDITPKRFLLHRYIRIVPFYWMLTSFYMFLLLLTPSVFREATFNLHRFGASYFFLSKALLDVHPYLGQGWTLEFEVLFYLLFASALFFSVRWKIVIFLYASLIVLVVVFGVKSILYEFLLGTSVGFIHRYAAISKAVYAVLLIVGSILFISTLGIHPNLPRWVVWGLPSALIVLGAAGAYQFDWRLGRWLGDASYSIYLVQIFSVPAFYKLSGLFRGGAITLSGDAAVIACVTSTAIAGLLVYRIVENPMLKWLRRSSQSPILERVSIDARRR